MQLILRVILAISRSVLRLANSSRLRRRLHDFVVFALPRYVDLPSVAPIECQIRGLNLTLDLADNVQRQWAFLGAYEPELTDFILACTPPGSVFLDVGAHIGTHSLQIAKHAPSVRVHSFEPSPDTATRLRQHVLKNSLTNVRIHETALGEMEGAIRLFDAPRWGDGDAGVRSVYGTGRNSWEVRQTTFDTWASSTLASEDTVAVVKMDVEGHEWKILRGGQRFFATYKPRFLIVEAGVPQMSAAGSSIDDLNSAIRGMGYRLYRSIGENRVYRLEDTD